MNFAALFEHLYQRPPVGESEETLAAAEVRLGVLLPEPLRSFYRACGREDCVMAAHNQFLALPSLELVDGRLIFCEENQVVCVWGSVVGEPDPKAEVGNVLPDGTLEWHSEEVVLSRFLEIMVYLQTAWGGYEHAGDLQEPEGALVVMARDWTRVVQHNGLTIYEQPGVLVCSLEGLPFITAGALTETDLERLERDFGFNPL